MDGTMQNGRSISGHQRDGSVTERIVTAVAEARGVDPLELDTRLHDVVDPDAIERLCSTGPGSQSADARVAFTMGDCEVVVDRTGRVTATPLADQQR